MIVTLTPNPSIDRTVTVTELLHGEVHRATESRIDPGGKGINVARALTANGSEALAVLPTGGPEGHLMEELLQTSGTAYTAVPIAGTTRINIAVIEPDGTTTKINEPGPTLSEDEQAAVLAAVDTALAVAEWVVGCGSLSPGQPTELYAALVARAHAAGVRCAVDTSGAPLTAAVPAHPDLIKPNHEELEELVGRSLPTLGEVVEAAKDLVAQGISTVVVSLGGDGAVLVDAEGVAHAGATISDPLSTVGAGDCLLAGLLHVLAAGGSGREALVSGVRWGAAAVRLPGSEVPGPTDLDGIPVEVSDQPDLSRVLG